MTSIPWEERPAGSSDVLWRSSRNPIVPRNHIPRANSIFNSAVVPYCNGFAGVFRVDDTRRVMNLHAGRSADGIDWAIDADPIAFEAGDERVGETDGAVRARLRPARDAGSRTGTTSPGATATTARRSGSGTRTTSRRSISSRTRSCRSTGTACFFRAGSETGTRCSAARVTTGTRPSARSSTPRARTSSTGAGTDTSWRPGRSPGSRRRSEPARRRSRPRKAGSSSTTAC